MKALVFLILLNICLYASNREEELFNAIANRDISEVKQAIYKKVNINAKISLGRLLLSARSYMVIGRLLNFYLRKEQT